MAEFLMVLRGNPAEWKRLSAEQTQAIMERYRAFVDCLKHDGRFVSASALKDRSVHVQPDGKQTVVDGPYAETKEMLTGYFLFRAADSDEALTIAKQCPALTHGESIELTELTN